MTIFRVIIKICFVLQIYLHNESHTLAHSTLAPGFRGGTEILAYGARGRVGGCSIFKK